jgi:hypothetical protein
MKYICKKTHYGKRLEHLRFDIENEAEQAERPGSLKCIFREKLNKKI